MASFMKYSYSLSEKKGMVQTAILILELILLSSGVVSTFFMLKKSVSSRYLVDMVHCSMRELVNSLKSFLSSPLYICLFINSIVILILTFSKFHHPILNFLNVLSQISPPAKPQHHEKEEYMPKRTNSVIAMDTVMSFFSRYSHPVSLEDNQDEMPSVKDIDVDHVQTPYFQDISHLAEASEIKKPCSPNPRHETINYQNTRKTKTQQTNQEKIVNEYKFEEFNIVEPVMNPEEEEYDSLESAWKAINGGGIKKNKLKKSATCKWPVTPEKLVATESIESKDLLPSVAATWKDMRKSLTFNDALSTFRRGGLRGDFSVSTEESNKSFDDFIKKINHERVLQRQESDQRTLNNKLNRAR